MSADYSRPSRYARWGWWGAALNALLVAVNLACVFVWDGGSLNWMAVAIYTASGVFVFRVWRQGVRLDREHRAVMARLTGRLYGHEAQQ